MSQRARCCGVVGVLLGPSCGVTGCAATPYRSEVLNPPREGTLPDLLPILVESERLVGGCGRPDTPFHLALELARRPARIAKRDQALLRPLVGSDVAEDFAARSHRHAPVDIERARATVIGRVDHKAQFPLDRAAGEDANL